MKEKAKMSYNFENDIFLARPLKREYDSSFQIGNFILDLDSNNNIKGIEVLNASRLFGVPKSFLKNIKSGQIELVVSEKYIQINIQVKTKIRNTENTSSLSIERVKPEFISQSELFLGLV